MAVAAHFSKRERNSASFVRSTPTAISFTLLMAKTEAFLKPLMMTSGETPWN
jgi:hypothetical protein